MDEFNPNIPDEEKTENITEPTETPVADETPVKEEPVSEVESQEVPVEDDGESLNMIAEAAPENTEEVPMETAKEPVAEDKEEKKTDSPMPPRPPVEKKKSKAPAIVIGMVAVLAIGLGVYAFTGGTPKEPVESTPVETPVVTETPAPTPKPTPTPTPTPTVTPEPTPEPTPEVVKDIEGTVSAIKEDTIEIVVDGDEVFECFYDESLEETVAALTVDNTVKFTYTVDGNDMVITALEVVEKLPEEDNEVAPPEATPSMEDVFADFKNELQIISQREPTETENPDEPTLPTGEKIETLTLEADVPNSGDTWFRFSWKKNDTTPVVPGVNDVVVELKTPSGTLINQDNISRYGRFWIEGNILNYAIKNAKAGTWAFCVTKSESQSLGDIGANLVPLTGFINIDKVSIDYVGDDLYAIWKITGVKDECYGITITAKDAKGSNILVYSGSTSDGLHLIDTVKLSTAKLPSGTYDFEVVVQDWDASTVNGVQRITSKSMTHTVSVNGVEIK